MNIDLIAHLIGFLGMILVVTAFYKTVNNQWPGNGYKFNLWNFTGATLLLLSLIIHFNLGSFIIEVFWIAISGMGLYKNRGKKNA